MKKIILCMVLVGILFLAGCQAEQVECPDCVCNYEEKECSECEQQECPEVKEALGDKALLDVTMYSWGINELDTSEVFFTYWVTNFGDAEARDIKIKCDLLDIATESYLPTIDGFGNIASRSTVLGEVLTKKPIGFDMDKEYSGFCWVNSCGNCDILYKRIPELVESLG